MKPRAPDKNDYDVKLCAPGDLPEPELAACLAIIKAGDAVAVNLEKLEGAKLLAVARKGDQIVGVGAIKKVPKGYASDKPVRCDYASGIATKSGVPFSADTPELGYVAVHPDHRGKQLSQRLVEALQSKSGKTLFATTSSDAMKRTLIKAGFVQRGREWKGRRQDQLSLWLRQ